MTFDWSEVWDRKGKSDSEDPIFLAGFDQLDFKIDLKTAAQTLTEALDIQPSDRVLEVGCAAGSIAKYLNCKYVGVDRSEPLVKKNISINQVSALVCEANDLIFRDKTFDKVFVFTVFHYFPSHDYARQVIKELLRVARKAVYIGDLPVISHDPNHTLYTPEFFEDWEASKPLYPREHRFSIIKHL